MLKKEMYSVAEAAEYLECDQETVIDQCRYGELIPAVRLYDAKIERHEGPQPYFENGGWMWDAYVGPDQGTSNGEIYYLWGYSKQRKHHDHSKKQEYVRLSESLMTVSATENGEWVRVISISEALDQCYPCDSFIFSRQQLDECIKQNGAEEIKSLGKRKEAYLLKTIGVLARTYVESKVKEGQSGNAYGTAAEPNISRVVEDILCHVNVHKGADSGLESTHGLEKSSLSKRISSGLKLLNS